MLYHLFDWLEHQYHFPGARLFQYITFRAGLSIIISLIIMVVMGNRLIRSIKNWQVSVRLRVLAEQAKKDLQMAVLKKIADIKKALVGLKPGYEQKYRRYLELNQLLATQSQKLEGKSIQQLQDEKKLLSKSAIDTTPVELQLERMSLKIEFMEAYDALYEKEAIAKLLQEYHQLVLQTNNPLQSHVVQKGQEVKTALLAFFDANSVDTWLEDITPKQQPTANNSNDIALEEQRNLGLPEEQLKAKTPTMGGIIIHLAIFVPCLLLADLTNVYVQLLLLSTAMMGFIGFLDDYLKLTKGKDGLAGKYKVMGQITLGAIVGAAMLFHNDVVVRASKDDVAKFGYDVVDTVMVDHFHKGTKEEMYYVKTTMTNVPFFKGNEFDYKLLVSFLGDNAKNFVWIIFIPIIIFIITAVSNAANLTDGIDGLAAGTSAIVGATLAVLAYVSGNTVLADYLGVLYVPHAGEITIFTSCFMGACIGFLWYNAYPAKVFMGDTGSLALGSIIAVLAIVIRKELLIPLLCGIFLVENLSVMLQVAVFKHRKKKYGLEYAQKNRLFLMSPLHHHFQKKGMHESQIVIRFWIVGIILAVLTIITLKIR